MEIKNAITAYIIKNRKGAFAKITNLGGIIMELHVHTKSGVLRDVVLGFDNPEDYLNDHPYFGAIIGRYSNRIANGQFQLNGTTHTLTKNNGINNLHGGIKGFDKYIWNIKSTSKNSIALTMQSPDGDEGFPGTLDVEVTYTLTDSDQLVIDYFAKPTDKTTIVNLTNHSYFNLDGAGQGNILDHTLMIDADYITAVDDNVIPLKASMAVDGTPFDFRNPTKIGEQINVDHEQIRIGSGYDHNFIINSYDGNLHKIGSIQSSDNQVTMTIISTKPGVQLYTANQLNITGKGGIHYGNRSAFCLETQHFPDSPNRADFPSTVVNIGEEYRSRTVYGFGERLNE